MFGYAVNFDVKNIKIAIYDQDKSELSRDFINSLKSSEYFNIVGFISKYDDVNKYLDQKIARCIVVIPSDLSTK